MDIKFPFIDCVMCLLSWLGLKSVSGLGYRFSHELIEVDRFIFCLIHLADKTSRWP